MKSRLFSVLLIMFIVNRLNGQWYGTSPLWTPSNVGIGTSVPDAKLHIVGNAGILNLQGEDHIYIQWFPDGYGAGRKAYTGFPGAAWNDFYISNEIPDGKIVLNPGSNSPVQLNYGASKKLETTSTGIRISGNSTNNSNLLVLHNTANWATPMISNISWQDYASANVAAIGAKYDPSISTVDILFNSQYNNGYKETSETSMIIKGNGNVGIGKIDPTFRVHIANTNLDNSAFNTLLAIDGNTNDESTNNNFDASKPSVGLVFRREWNSGGIPRALAGIYAWGAYNWAGGLAFTTTPAYAYGVQHTRMVITDDGNVGIGNTTPGDFKLNVSGKIRANEIVVNTSGADFVLDPGYNLPDLAEVEKYIEENKHLPDVAPALDMQTEGMNVSEMQTKLLQKVEELTLYLIVMEKKNKVQDLKIKELENKLKMTVQ
ncbi:MAG TPA: hypothetical protein VHO50_12005 [Bacteroidales bacterium]|nr:hypothetical protein [Bacteroidales bacterium]